MDMPTIPAIETEDDSMQCISNADSVQIVLG